jgi:hypothetical protein
MSHLRFTAKLVRFSTEEIARVRERARSYGYTSARYIRETALGAIPKARHHADRDALFRDFARIGRELEWLTRIAELHGQDQFRSADRTQLRSVLAAHQSAVRTFIEERQAVLRPNDLLFAGNDRWTAGDAHRAACLRAEIHNYQMRDQRHSYAVRAARAGTPAELIARQLGHANAVLVLKVYGALCRANKSATNGKDWLTCKTRKPLESQRHPVQLPVRLLETT